MNFEIFLNSSAVQSYFGKYYPTWKSHLEVIVEKRDLAASSIDDHVARRRLMFTPNFSWMALLFNHLWIVYHRGKGGVVIALAIYLIVFLSSVVNLGIVPSVVGWVSVALFGLYGRSYIFACKAEEFSSTGFLTPPSLMRAIFVLLIGVFLSFSSVIAVIIESF